MARRVCHAVDGFVPFDAIHRQGTPGSQRGAPVEIDRLGPAASALARVEAQPRDIVAVPDLTHASITSTARLAAG